MAIFQQLHAKQHRKAANNHASGEN
jgi:hypothetical protein